MVVAPVGGFLFPFSAAAQITYTGKRNLTLDEVWGPFQPLPSWGSLPYITGWSSVPDPLTGNPRYWEFADNHAGDIQLMRVDARTGAAAPLFDATRMEAVLAALPDWDSSAAHKAAFRESYLLDKTETRALLSHANGLYLYDSAGKGRAVRLTAPVLPLPAENAAFSPDNQSVAFVRGGDLYTVEVAAPGKERRLTTGGNRILHGQLDWLYGEEVYDRDKENGYAWSADSRHLTFLQLNETRVPRTALVNTLPTAQTTEEQRYPHPGEPNPVAALGFVAADGKTPPVYADLSAYDDQNRLIVRFGWDNGGGGGERSDRVWCEVQDRTQTFLDLLAADPATGKTVRLFRERSGGPWTEVIALPLSLHDGTFLWQSDRTGFRHLYRYQSATGVLIGAVTSGDWDVRTVFGTDPAQKGVYFSASEHSPLATHIYRVSLAAGGEAAPPPQRLTGAEGSHQGRFDPAFSCFLDQWSGFDTPPHLRVADTENGADIRVLGDSAETIRRLAPIRFARPEFVHVPARDGFVMEGMLLRPPDFDPAKKYPIFCPVYGGPGAQTVRDAWNGRDFLFYQLLAQKGYVVWLCDNRSASGKGTRTQWPLFRRLGSGELSDIEDGLAYVAALPGMDTSRVGIFGWSYGGFLAEYALTHSSAFKVGISAAGVSDWRLYDTIYTERYLDTPERNPDGYKASSAANAAGECHGRLLLLHGLMDDNVHVQNSFQMAYGLQKNGKAFDMMLYPGPEARHGFADSQLDSHLNREIVDFILRYL